MSFFEKVVKAHELGTSDPRNQKSKKWMQEIVSTGNIERANELINEDIEKE